MLILRVALAFSLVPVAFAQNPLQVASPNGQIVFTLSGEAVLHYAVTFRGKPLMDPSELPIASWSRLALCQGAARQQGRQLYHPGRQNERRPRSLQFPDRRIFWRFRGQISY